jgi:RND family efflux transporter MFP subunit
MSICSEWSRYLFWAIPLGAVMVFSTASAQGSPERGRENFRAFDPGTSEVSRDAGIVGVVYPSQRFLLAFSASGIVGQVPVKEGELVRSGANLMVLEQASERLELQRLELLFEDQSALRAARSRVDLLRRQLQTAQDLYDRTRSISMDELNAMKMRLVDLEADLSLRELEKKRESLDVRIARSELAKRTLQAPSPGYVVQIKLKRGEWAQAGDPVVELADVSLIYIRFSVPPSRARGLALGASVSFDIEGQRSTARVVFVSPVADPASGLVEVRVEADNRQTRLRPGVQARVFL